VASKYANEHASALADVAAAGTDITFVGTVPGTVSLSTDIESGATTVSVTGAAIEDEPDSDAYRSLGLTHETGVSLFFAPTTTGVMPKAGYTTTWGGDTITVKRVRSYNIDGEGAICAQVIASR
jgi:copper chaperone CopZ